MFGAFRFVLALMVMHSHFAGGGLAGPVAVFGFFCLSGYLMTRIVNETYSDGLSGYLRYLGNRALRIYPAYFAALAIAAGVLLLWPVEARTAAGWYARPEDWLSTMTIFGLQPRSPILVIPAWSLHVELIHYVLIGAVLGRSKQLTSLWSICALATPLVAMPLGSFSFDWLYFSPFGSSVAFATGALVYHYRDKLPSLSPSLAVIACIVLIYLGLNMSVEAATAGGMHLSILITAVIITSLTSIPMRRWDSALGDLAYPAFLVHIPCRAMMQGLLGGSGMWVDAAAIGATVILSGMIVVFVEWPLRNIRTKLRSPHPIAAVRLAE